MIKNIDLVIDDIFVDEKNEVINDTINFCQNDEKTKNCDSVTVDKNNSVRSECIEDDKANEKLSESTLEYDALKNMTRDEINTSLKIELNALCDKYVFALKELKFSDVFKLKDKINDIKKQIECLNDKDENNSLLSSNEFVNWLKNKNKK